jgi:DNA-binding MarR family transcriptional regulator
MSSIMQKQVDVVNQSADGPAADVVESIHTVMHLFRSRQYRALRDGPHDLTHMEGKALGFFARHPGASQRDLVQGSGRDKGQVARLISGLKERGLLDAQEDERDRRSQRLRVSKAGQEVQALLQQQRQQLSAQAIQGLSDEERRLLLALLARVQGNLERE